MSYTLSLYFGRQFLVWFAVVLTALAAIGLTLDSAELVRRGVGREGVSAMLVLEMAVLRLPYLMQQFLPFAALFGGVLSFLRLTRSNQLVVARGAGVSVWQFMAPALILATLIGVFGATVFDSFSSAAVKRFEQLEGLHLHGQASLLAISENGLWLRESGEQGQSVIHAERVTAQGRKLIHATIFRYEGADRFIGRIDAEEALLNEGNWELTDAILTWPERPRERHDSYELPTSLTLAQVQDSFAPPETLSFWELPRFIQSLQAAGFSALNHRIHWHRLLSSPLLLFAMVLIAAAFSLRLIRWRGAGGLVVASVLAGLTVYVVSDVALALGLSGGIPVAMAAWTPAGVCILLGTAALFHLEDG